MLVFWKIFRTYKMNNDPLAGAKYIHFDFSVMHDGSC